MDEIIQKIYLKHTGIQLCQHIAKIEGLPEAFIKSVNDEYNSIKSKSFSDNYNHGRIKGYFGVDQAHRILICNSLNEIKELLIRFRSNPDKYNWTYIYNTLETYNEFGNCDAGRVNAVSQLLLGLKSIRSAEAGVMNLVQKQKSDLINVKINEINSNVHANQRIKYLVQNKYGLAKCRDDGTRSIMYSDERTSLESYVSSQDFLKDFMDSLDSLIELHPVSTEGDGIALFQLSEKKILDGIFTKFGIDQEFIYRDGECKEWNANMCQIIKLHYIKEMLPLGIFSDEVKEKLAPLTNPSVIKLLAVLGHNIKSDVEREGFIEDMLNCEGFEKPNSAYRISNFYSYNELLVNILESEHCTGDYVRDFLDKLISENNMELYVVCNIDSYQITRLAYMIVHREKSSEQVSYRDLSSLLDSKLTKDHLHKIAAEVQRIEEKNGFVRTLQDCLYAVLVFFRAIIGMSTLDKDTKTNCETFLYADASKHQSFVELVGLKDNDQQAL